MTDRLVIETSGLRKTYGAHEAVRGLNLAVPRGSIFGFLGRNGAGKTTTIKILLGMVRASGGDARVFGLPAGAAGASVDIRSRTGFVGEDKELYDYMTVEEIVRFTAVFYPRWRADLEQRYRKAFELPADRRVKALSKGMRTKLALLLALCRGAELLILDEPTSGLDPAMTEEVLQALVSHVAAEEMTVFFSSHQIAEVDQIADHIAIIDRVFDGDAPDARFSAPGVVRIRRKGRVLTVLASSGADRLVEEARAFNPVSVEIALVTLKEIFLETVTAEA